MILSKRIDGGVKVYDMKGKALKEFVREHITAKGELTEEIRFYKGFTPKFEKAENGFLWTLSTDDLDRDGEKVNQAGWRLDTYKRNPVVLWAHDHRIPAIGRMEDPAIVDNTLKGRVVMNGEWDPFGYRINLAIQNGVLNAGSVGFIPLVIQLVMDKEDPADLIFEESELIEFSICNVPANPFALRDPKGFLGTPEPKSGTGTDAPPADDPLAYLFGKAEDTQSSALDYLFGK